MNTALHMYSTSCEACFLIQDFKINHFSGPVHNKKNVTRKIHRLIEIHDVAGIGPN